MPRDEVVLRYGHAEAVRLTDEHVTLDDTCRGGSTRRQTRLLAVSCRHNRAGRGSGGQADGKRRTRKRPKLSRAFRNSPSLTVLAD
jgi:hypothetical protein